MASAHKDPTQEPYKVPSQRRHLWGTVANRNSWIITGIGTAVISLCGAVMIYGVLKRNEDREKGLLGPYMFPWFAKINKPEGLSEQQQIEADEARQRIRREFDETLIRMKDPDSYKFWKGKYWGYDSSD